MITEITIKLKNSDKIINLTNEQAKELKNDLNELFQQPAMWPTSPLFQYPTWQEHWTVPYTTIMSKSE